MVRALFGLGVRFELLWRIGASLKVLRFILRQEYLPFTEKQIHHYGTGAAPHRG